MAEKKANDLAKRIARLPRPLLLALDVDGTLAPIVDDPERAQVPHRVVVNLRALAKRRDVHIALISGRDAASLSKVVRVPHSYRAVSHGREIITPVERAKVNRETPEQKRRLDAFARWAKRHARKRGARLEINVGARAVHVRELAAKAPALAKKILADAHAEALRLELHPREGRSVVEVEAEPGDKAAALDTIYRASKCRGVFYAGDDLTDQPAIAHAVALGGIGVFVRSVERPRKPRRATAVVDGPEAIEALLAALLDALG